MKDMNRIYKINQKINAIWLTYPDLRFFQLMECLKGAHLKISGDKVLTPGDFFYIEDESFDKTLDTVLEKGLTKI